jgi:hypothetical protein
MIRKLKLVNLGPLDALEWAPKAGINVLVGRNMSGKTMLLKALYVTQRVIEQHGRGEERRSLGELASEKLYWTFQCGDLHQLVRREGGRAMELDAELTEGALHVEVGPRASRNAVATSTGLRPRSGNSLFFPAKEVLSLHASVLRSRDELQSFGFDDTYYDLARALLSPTSKGKNIKAFADARTLLAEHFGGRMEMEAGLPPAWYFKQGNRRTPLGVTAEGVRKIGILDQLLGNRYLTADSVLFFDEPESALHPDAILLLMEILLGLAAEGMQIFLSTHSYFVLKALGVLAAERGCGGDVGWLSLGGNGPATAGDLSAGLPENPIIRSAIQLYERQIGDWGE